MMRKSRSSGVGSRHNSRSMMVMTCQQGRQIPRSSCRCAGCCWKRKSQWFHGRRQVWIIAAIANVAATACRESCSQLLILALLTNPLLQEQGIRNAAVVGLLSETVGTLRSQGTIAVHSTMMSERCVCVCYVLCVCERWEKQCCVRNKEAGDGNGDE